MSLPEVLKTALDQIQHIAKTETVFGEPMIAGQVTIIPVSKISIGFAAGGNTKTSGGAGTGGGVSIVPVAFITICNDKVSVHSIEKGGLPVDIAKIMTAAPDLIKKVSEFLGKGKSKKEESPKTDTQDTQ